MGDETKTMAEENANKPGNARDYRREFSETRVKSHPTRAARRKPLDKDGRERPAFLLNFPEEADLDALIAAFERGDFGAVREQAPRLIQATKEDDVREAARQLLLRTGPDPVLKLFLGAAVGLLLFVTVWVYL